MTDDHSSGNRIREFRQQRDWTQAELAQRAGISRTAVTAMESGTLNPSVSSALAIAAALETTVESLFAQHLSSAGPAWALEVRDDDSPYQLAEVGGRRWKYPAESSGAALPDSANSALAQETLVVASCDPAAGWLARLYSQRTGLRMLVVHASSRHSLELLRQGKVHAAGMHLATADDSQRNATVAREVIPGGFRMLGMASWHEGIASASAMRLRSARSAVRGKLKWVGREPGSGARQCLDRLLPKTPRTLPVARDHRQVTAAISSGWAQVGICVQLAAREAGLDFLAVQQEHYELCIPDQHQEDHRVRALVATVRSRKYRELMGGAAGYDVAAAGSWTAKSAPLSSPESTDVPS